MNPLEQALLHEATGQAEPELLLRTRTRVNTGRWWRASPLWLCVMAEEVVVFAVGRRRYLQRIPVAECRESYYHHATGALVVFPAAGLSFRHLRMKPSEALRALALLSPSTPSPHQHP